MEDEMVEKYLEKEQIDEIFAAGVKCAAYEMSKEAVAPAAAAAGKGLSLAAVGSWLSGLVGGGYTAVTEGAAKTYDLARSLALAGLATGALTGVGYNLVKERMQEKSPEEEVQRKIESMYSNKRQELESARWMTRVRSMRDELRRGYKKMSTREYTDKYNALMEALDERRA